MNNDAETEEIKTGDSGGAEGNTKEKARMELYDWIQCIVSAILCGIFIFVFVGRTIGVEGVSMRQTLHENDRVIVSGLFYKPKYGDIIIFNPPTDAFNNTPLVKRVIAVEGQTVDINYDTGEVTVDGVVLEEDTYINERIDGKNNAFDFDGPQTIKDGHVFVMGDNRNNSRDSRDPIIGEVDTRYIIGKVLLLFLPGADETGKRDWSRLGFVP